MLPLELEALLCWVIFPGYFSQFVEGKKGRCERMIGSQDGSTPAAFPLARPGAADSL